MRAVTCLLFCVAVFSGYLTENVHKQLTLLPEVISGLILLLVILKVGVDRSMVIPRSYVILGLLAGLHGLAGMLLNFVEPGVILNGLRPHLKWIPIFLLPMVFQVSARQLRTVLACVLALAVIQTPLALYQRFVEFKDVPTGDVITGTLGFGGSGALSILLVGVISIVVAFYAAQRIRIVAALVLGILLFVPTTINETKATVILLPIALAFPFLFSAKRRLQWRQIVTTGLMGAILLGAYVVVYETYTVKKEVAAYGVGLLDFFSSEKTVRHYFFADKDVSKGALKRDSLGNVQLAQKKLSFTEGGSRIDKILLPLKSLSDDPVRLWFGTGVGNVSGSAIKSFAGEFSGRLEEIANDSSLSFVLWETGIGGTVCLFVFLYLVFRDSLRLAGMNVPESSLAAGWTAVVAIFFITTPYINVLYFNALIYLFAYFSGYIAAQRSRHELGEADSCVSY